MLWERRHFGPSSGELADQYLLAGRYQFVSGVAVHRSENNYLLSAVDHHASDIYTNVCSKYIGGLDETASGDVISSDALKACIEEIERMLLIEPTGIPINLAEFANGMPRDELLGRLCDCYGVELPVVLKFTSQKEIYRLECDARMGVGANAHIVGLLPSFTEQEFTVALQEFDHNLSLHPQPALEELKLSTYRYCLVMPVATRNLYEVLRHERPGPLAVRSMVQDVAQALQHLHDRRIMHGHLKPQHIVRARGSMRLVDFSASAKFMETVRKATDAETAQSGGTDGMALVGARFSTGYLAPELFCRLSVAQEDQFNDYWAAERGADSALWHKVRPVYVLEKGQLSAYVVRTTAAREGTEEAGGSSAVDAEKSVGGVSVRDVQDAARSTPSAAASADNDTDLFLPFSLVPASPQIDMWALGAILFEAITGQSLLRIDKDGNICDPTEYTRITSWLEQRVGGDGAVGVLTAEIVSHIVDPLAAHLLAQLLLQPRPEHRPALMDEVLHHPYFHVEADVLLAADCEGLTSIDAEVLHIEEWYRSARLELHGVVDHTHAVSSRIMALQRTPRRCPGSWLCTPRSARFAESGDEEDALLSEINAKIATLRAQNTTATTTTMASSSATNAVDAVDAVDVPRANTTAAPASVLQRSSRAPSLTGASAAADEDVVKALMSAIQNWEGSYRTLESEQAESAGGSEPSGAEAKDGAFQRSLALGTAVETCERRSVGGEGAVLRGPHGVEVVIPPGAMAPYLDSREKQCEVSLEIVQSLVKYAHLPRVSPTVRLTPSNYQFRKPVFVTVPHCLRRATKANLCVCLFDVEGGLRNVLDPSAIEFLPESSSLRFPVMFACDAVVVFRDASETRHLCSDVSRQVATCAVTGCEANRSLSTSSSPPPLGGKAAASPATRVQCRFCDAVYCPSHCAQRLQGQPCCDDCLAHSWTVYMSVTCVASELNSDVRLAIEPCFRPDRVNARPDCGEPEAGPSEQVLACSFRGNKTHYTVQVNLTEREFTQAMLQPLVLNFKAPSIAVVMVSDATRTDQDPCQWKLYKA